MKKNDLINGMKLGTKYCFLESKTLIERINNIMSYISFEFSYLLPLGTSFQALTTFVYVNM